MKKIGLLSLLVSAFLLGACTENASNEEASLTVVTTLFPQYSVVNALAGEYVNNVFILPFGADAHDFEPTPGNVTTILRSDLLIYTGDDMERWVTRAIRSQNIPGLTILDLSQVVDLMEGGHDHDHSHDHGHSHEATQEIDTFEILNRRDDRNVAAYVKGSHWHGTLPNVEVGGSVSLGATIVSIEGRQRELDADGEVNGLQVQLAPGALEGVVEFEFYGDHVHIRGLQEGATRVQFVWTHRGEVRYTSPAIRVQVGEGDVPHEHQTAAAFGEIESFEILNRRDNRSVVADIDGDHWHGRLPVIDLDGSLSLGATIVSVGGRVRELDSEGEVNGLEVRLTPGAAEGIVAFDFYGDHVHIRGISEGQTSVQFLWTHRGEVRYITPAIRVQVGETDHDDDHDDHDDDHDGHDHGEFDPHYWLDPHNLEAMAKAIAKELIFLVPQHEASIRVNLANYLELIEQYEEDVNATIAKAQTRTLIHGGHNAFGYFAAHFGLNYVTPYSGFSTEIEPSPQARAELVRTMNTTGSLVIYAEEFVNPRVASAIAAETGAEIIYLFTGENTTQELYNEGVTLLDMLYLNLERLKKGLNVVD